MKAKTLSALFGLSIAVAACGGGTSDSRTKNAVVTTTTLVAEYKPTTTVCKSGYVLQIRTQGTTKVAYCVLQATTTTVKATTTLAPKK